VIKYKFNEKNVAEFWHYFVDIISNILFVSLTGFRNCWAEYTVHSLSPCYGLLTALPLVLLNSVPHASLMHSIHRCTWKSLQFSSL